MSVRRDFNLRSFAGEGSAVGQTIFALNAASAAFQSVFGRQPLPFFLKGQPNVGDSQDFSLNAAFKDSQDINFTGTNYYKKDKYGVDVFMPIAFRYDGIELFLPYCTLTLEGGKRIETTNLVNRRGSVHEQISINNYAIGINGVALSRESDYPEQEVSELSELWETREPIEIINPLLDHFLPEDSNVIIKGFSMPPMVGISGAQAFSMQLESDDNLELVIE